MDAWSAVEVVSSLLTTGSQERFLRISSRVPKDRTGGRRYRVTHVRVTVLIVMGSLLLAGQTMLAQDSGEISGRLGWLRSGGAEYQTGYIDLTAHVTDLLSMVGEFSASERSEDGFVALVPVTIDFKIYALTGGINLRLPVHPFFAPFGQVTVGRRYDRTSTWFAPAFRYIRTAESDAVINVSGGVSLADRYHPLGVRMQIGWMRNLEKPSNAFSLGIGALIRF